MEFGFGASVCRIRGTMGCARRVVSDRVLYLHRHQPECRSRFSAPCACAIRGGLDSRPGFFACAPGFRGPLPLVDCGVGYPDQPSAAVCVPTKAKTSRVLQSCCCNTPCRGNTTADARNWDPAFLLPNRALIQ